MNYRAILKAYIAERGLTDDETAFLNTLRKMTDAERGMFVEGLTDKSQKKAGKKSASKLPGKTARASGMASAISRSLESSRKAAVVDNANDECVQCGKVADANEHHLQNDPNYHPFSPPAQSVDKLSLRKSSIDESIASSATEKDAVGSVVQGASGGD